MKDREDIFLKGIEGISEATDGTCAEISVYRYDLMTSQKGELLYHARYDKDAYRVYHLFQRNAKEDPRISKAALKAYVYGFDSLGVRQAIQYETPAFIKMQKEWRKAKIQHKAYMPDERKH